MATRNAILLVGFTLFGAAASASAIADDLLGLYNPLGFYVGGDVGRTDVNETQFDRYGDYFRHVDGPPLGGDAVVALRPIPVVGAEAEYIDFGNTRLGAGPPFLVGGATQQFLGGEAHDRAAGVFSLCFFAPAVSGVETFAA